jgi:hypothetical protein
MVSPTEKECFNKCVIQVPYTSNEGWLQYSPTLTQSYCSKCSLPKLANHWNYAGWSSTTALEHTEWTRINYLRYFISSVRTSKELCSRPTEQNLRIQGKGVSDENENEICQTHALTHAVTFQPEINHQVQTTFSRTVSLV